MTDSQPDPDSTPSKPRGLWSLMGAPTEDLATPAAPLPDEATKPQPDASTTESPKPRGLWGMMQSASIPSTDSDDTSSSNVSDNVQTPDEQTSAARHGLFALMQRVDDKSTETDRIDPELRERDEPPRRDNEESVVTIRRSAMLSSDKDDDDIEITEEAILEEVVEDAHPREGLSSIGIINPEEIEPPRFQLAARQARKQAICALGAGIAALMASSLSLLPSFLASLPATCLGFVAIIASYLSLTGAGRREISSAMRGLSLGGMLLGTIGIFLGPLFIASLGRQLREATGQQLTRTHLQQIGEALDRHYTEHDAYPIGGTFARADNGAIKGQHGWMTFLLPYVGETELFRSIDQSKAFDDPVNHNAMGHNVRTYFAAGGDKSRIGDGFAVSHFAGVGGEIDEANGLSHLGIFERDVAIKRDEVTDGLANTLIVGELPGSYPPWGDPENWRKIGRGLNKDANGFGSYSGNGATFLLGDGCVKFFSNKTDSKLLEKMSTRNGGE